MREEEEADLGAVPQLVGKGTAMVVVAVMAVIFGTLTLSFTLDVGFWMLHSTVLDLLKEV